MGLTAMNEITIDSSEIEEIMSGLLTPDEEASEDGSDSGCELWTLSSINDAYTSSISPQRASMVSTHRQHMSRIADYIINNSDKISGSRADWHNIWVRFSTDGDFISSLALAEAGLRRFPCDAILLADAINAAGQIGDWATGDRLVERAESPDYRADEDWRLAVYVADYLCSKAHAQGLSDRVSTYERALRFVREAIDRLPPNDHLINKEAEILIDYGKVDEARGILEGAIFRRDTIAEGVADPTRIPVPQCCLTYLEKILGDSCEYDTIIKIADAGIRFLKIAQTSVKVHYFFYRKALAMDGKIHMASGGAQTANQDYVRNAMRTYAIAYALADPDEIRDTCRANFLVLGVLGGIDDLKINAFCSSATDITSQ